MTAGPPVTVCHVCDRPWRRSHRCRGPGNRTAMPDWFRDRLAAAVADQAAHPDLPAQCDGQLPLPLHFTFPDPE